MGGDDGSVPVRGSTADAIGPAESKKELLATDSATGAPADSSPAKGEAKAPIQALEDRQGWLSKLTFSFLNDIVDRAHEKMLMVPDLLELGDNDFCSKILNRFEQHWKAQSAAAGDDAGSSVLLWTFYSMMPGMWWKSIALEFVTRVPLFLTPFLLDWMIQYLQGDGPQHIAYGLGLAIVMGLCILISGVAENRMQMILSRISMNMQASIMGEVYRKYFRLAPASLAQVSSGKIINMVGEDTQRIFQLMPIVNFLWSAPLQMLVVVLLLFLLVGWAPTLGALGVLVLVVYVMRWSNDKTQELEKERAGLMDKRVRLLGELVQGIKAVKLYTWEDPMKRSIGTERGRELNAILKIYLLRALNVALFTICPVLMAIVIFFLFVEQGNTLNAANVFGTIALVNLVRFPLIILPILQTSYNSSKVSFLRIHNFLTLDERTEDPKIGNLPRGQITLPTETLYAWPQVVAGTISAFLKVLFLRVRFALSNGICSYFGVFVVVLSSFFFSKIYTCNQWMKLIWKYVPNDALLPSIHVHSTTPQTHA